MKHLKNVQNEDGSTLVETLVAMAILVSVLLPVSMFFVYIANNPQNKEKILAIGLAQSTMENTLNSEKYFNKNITIESKWVIKQSIIKEKELLQIKVSVYRTNQPKPIVTLTTERLFYGNRGRE